ncbi:related to POL1-DNA-directed DNA polymerase alpha, 180 KD subunit [Armillaria ostoyae]|uniref:DNA polymerase n=1 Tax=Armillaria ostoyae TaxID=47428 RepID=A0A284R3M1_ARMOS|nr:related to POL1-DNA-directed DNA polymerase alpha, 180 KD subunit [Armillaria ostoyae]
MSSRGKKSKLEALAELKRARAGGSRKLKEEDVQIYDEVSEDQYNKIVKGRLQRDDFVVDDGVDGYMDNGMDDWAEAEAYDSDEDMELVKKAKKKSSKLDTKKPKARPRPPSPTPIAPTISAYRPKVSKDDEDSFMASLLGDIDAEPIPAVPKSRKRKTSPSYDYDNDSSPVPYRNHTSYADTSSDGPMDSPFPDTPSDDLIFSPKKKAKTDVVGMTPATQRLSRINMKPDSDFDVPDDFDFDMAAFDQMDDNLDDDLKPVKAEPVVASLSKKEEADILPSWLSVYDSLAVAEADTLGPLESSSSAASSSKIAVLEPDSSLRFFWLDYLEHEGKLYFVGKLKDKTTGMWVSCCVTVEGVERNLFVLPRDKRVEVDDENNMYETDEVPSLPDVYRDFDAIRKKVGIKSFKGKFVKRKYAFGETDVPREERQWMKVVYGFDQPQLPNTLNSPNISKIFGTNTTAFELLVLKRKIMGPCWLQIKNPKVDNQGISWCKLEVTVSDPKDFNPFSDSDPSAPKDTPPLTVMSLSVRTIVNHAENMREIVCATARIWHNMAIDDPKPPEQLPCTVQTFVRPLDRFPPNFETRAKANGKGHISTAKNERMLLSSLLVALHKADPDVIVGHEFLGSSLDVLLHRMKGLKVDHWSRLGRFRRSKWPNIGKQGSNIKFLSGRMLCDLASDGAKSMIASTTWSLTEMCKTHLKSDRQDIDPDDTASYLDSTVSGPERLMTFVQHCELDAHYHMAIASKVQILPLTKQLTNLAGNSWNKTLNGGRAERNEYILLHEFHRLKYICPDKSWGKKSKPEKKSENEDADGDGKPTKSKRDKYKGGLVFEPKRGLWDKFILVMDFNSLYPSIIQEYNIDFTTVDSIDNEHENEEEHILEPPGSSVAQGVLPRLIATLVNRRRQVKSLMKDKTATPAQLLQYDIKQQALKLTANSMYGCLGFEYSRFYARPLAALTTFKGREILTHTKELAESMQLDVVYGDTDSVFVNSNVTELPEALKIAAEFKKAVNDRYKLLEIDLDGIFQRLLLLQKKKYAAIKVEDGTRTSTEVKGLDMKRREYCALSKNVSQYVLEQILSGESTEIVVEQIHEYLTTIGKNVNEGKVKLDDFIVFKRLGKNPEEYPKVHGLPHVQVAMKMKARGGSARAGDVIPYIFCLAEGEESAKTGQADRARHPDELRKAESELKIDYQYYLSQQILPPIERLCDPIEGTDRTRLAECLGLDPSRYRTAISSSFSEEHAFASLDSRTSDTERFKDATPFIVRCPACRGELAFAPLNDRESSIVHAHGTACLSPACQKPIPSGSLQLQLEAQIRRHISTYYEGWTVCDDTTCGNRTRMMGVYGRRCLKQECRGSVAFEYSDAQLYDQLRYFSSLFDGERAVKAATGTSAEEEVSVLVSQQAVLLKTLSSCVDKYLDQCGRRWVEMGTLFSMMKI